MSFYQKLSLVTPGTNQCLGLQTSGFLQPSSAWTEPRVCLWHMKVTGGLCCCLEDAPKEFLSGSQVSLSRRLKIEPWKFKHLKMAVTFCQKLSTALQIQSVFVGVQSPPTAASTSFDSPTLVFRHRSEGRSSYHQSLWSLYTVWNRMSVQPNWAKPASFTAVLITVHEVLNIGTSKCIGCHLAKNTSEAPPNTNTYGANLSPRLLGQHRGPWEDPEMSQHLALRFDHLPSFTSAEGTISIRKMNSYSTLLEQLHLWYFKSKIVASCSLLVVQACSLVKIAK